MILSTVWRENCGKCNLSFYRITLNARVSSLVHRASHRECKWFCRKVLLLLDISSFVHLSSSLSITRCYVLLSFTPSSHFNMEIPQEWKNAVNQTSKQIRHRNQQRTTNTKQSKFPNINGARMATSKCLSTKIQRSRNNVLKCWRAQVNHKWRCN